jgi:hypothetical protein
MGDEISNFDRRGFIRTMGKFFIYGGVEPEEGNALQSGAPTGQAGALC